MKTTMKSETSKRLTRSQTHPFNSIPLTLIEEILMKLKAKCISKLIRLSKSWSSIVSNKDITNLYLMTQSLTRPRILFIINNRDPRMQFFYSCSQEDPSSTLDHERVGCYPPAKWYNFSAPVRGLICALNDSNNEVLIGNPTTGQFVTLPKVITRRKDILFFIGYDHVADVYKVLCMTVSRRRKRESAGAVSEEHQVFTLGAIRKKWRKIECEHLHYTPRGTQGICSNGVVYYLAWINHVQSLISFDVGSEKFSVIKLPRGVGILSNYGEKIAVTNRLYNRPFDLWVLEDASEQVWSKVSVLVPYSWTNILSYEGFRFRGTLGTGELIFAPCFIPDSYFLLCYDPKANKARRIEIRGIENNNYNIQVFLDHVESPMVLPSGTIR